jgi:putative heme-binding domain-containing protein
MQIPLPSRLHSAFKNIMHVPSLPVAALVLSAVSVTPALHAQAQPAFPIQNEDRVLLMGDTLLERENSFGHLETRVRLEFPSQKFSLRNLSFSADTPAGISRASFDPAAKGIERIREQLALVQPTVAILGYGMASSLEELTYRNGDTALGLDTARYGDDHTAAQFKKQLATLMDLITEASPGKKVRFILLSPLPHEDLRAQRPELPDPTAHNALLADYSKAIEELASERGARFVRSDWKNAGVRGPATDNGIHLNTEGYQGFVSVLAQQLGWKATLPNWNSPQTESLRQSVLRKHDLFFHRWRPANHTYLLGFRKREQGQNAAELPKFEPLVEKAESDTIALASGQQKTPLIKAEPPAQLAELPSQPLPDFSLAEGIEISLFAENPFLEKPVQMNWDSSGRLWVASSNTYPQVNPEDIAASMAGDASKFGPSTGNDKILVLEDTNHDGKADSSKIFADSLLIPSAITPDNRGGCYVGASTELVHLEPGPDGKASRRRVVLSGFGTEDTHHTLHTLHWGRDGRLYFHQSIYIHSHFETPWGVVRANSGAVFAYDPAAERVEVCSRGLINSWGQQEDRAGQMFLTDGAGGKGINWGFPGAAFITAEGARSTVDSVSPGSYPKFCGLELVQSPSFPADWQGNAITCDFRAHRIVRFTFNDLSTAEKPASGYVTKDMPDVVRTSDMSFRPIDVRMGPDGALYVADWSNPVINHGEVDFRDPRRDKLRGRIWRISSKTSQPLPWSGLSGKSTAQLLPSLLSENLWEQSQARQLLQQRPATELAAALPAWIKSTEGTPHAEPAKREAAWILSGKPEALPLTADLLKNSDPASVAAAIREVSRQVAGRPALWTSPLLQQVADLLHHSNPRVQLEAIRALTVVPKSESASAILAHLPQNPDDAFLDFSARLAISQLAKPWLESLQKGEWKVEGREAALTYALKAVEPSLAIPAIQFLLKSREFSGEAAGPWIELAGQGASPDQLRNLLDAVLKEKLSPPACQRALQALIAAAQDRNTRPSGALEPVTALLDSTRPELQGAAARLSGLWQLASSAPRLAALAKTPQPLLQSAALDGLRSLGGPAAHALLEELVAPQNPPPLQRAAFATLAKVKLPAALAQFPRIVSETSSESEASTVWRDLLQVGGASAALQKALPQDLPKWAYAGGLKAAREIGRNGADLATLLAPLAGGTAASPQSTAASVEAMIKTIASGADPAEGELIYRRIGCIQCHAIGGAGGKLGPDMSSLGASAPLDYIIESVLEPAAKVKEGYHAFSFSLKDGSQMIGIPSRETASEQFIRPGPVPEIPVQKAQILKRENVGSLMPPGLVDSLKAVERRNLFAFLGELGKPGAFDASKGNVARIWWLHSDRAAALSGTDSPFSAQTLVDGRLLRELLAPMASLAGGSDLYATAKFEASGPTRQPLILSGTKAAWLDGAPLSLDPSGHSTTSIPAGPHKLVVQLDPKALPELLKAQCNDARFLGE